MRTIPYVTTGEFRFHPTFLDTNQLVAGGSQPQQDSALNTALLTASDWADEHLFGTEGQIAAHVRTENARIRPDRQARLRYHPEHTPVSSVTSIAIGDNPTSQTTITGPTVWVEQGGRILVAYLFGASAPGLNAFQFGGTGGWRVEQAVTWTYVAGWAATQLAVSASAAATSVQVLDATGIAAGSVLRLWTPGLEEAVTVASVSGTTVALSGSLANAHQAGDSIQAVPTPIREAVINKAVCLLLRPNAAAQQPPVRSGVASTSTRSDPARKSGGGVYHDKACGLLRPYRRVR